IGGEYTAINSTIQELVPARYRGWTDLVINGSFWIGAALGATSAIVLLDPAVTGPDLGWRPAYLPGAALGLIVLGLRLWDARKPALADDPWSSRGGARDRRRYRALRDRARPECAEGVICEDQAEDARPHAAGRGRAYAVLGLSPALAGGADADGRAGVLLQ